ncbi:hypothetical protein K469DRAFT_786873 [Zopfia rhizophila CBS 207.26]|uniref:PKS/mFAS DH domain-containing protein n=1 Tax=Zopfia rhizophila CBS 207.26 TaxID=1314779 RepID=A0A6A6DY10_9PEZI|nr:hypothetical protein K469DRAFT_786873 [Zopfia rhizophila CBS 207.26]
MGKAYSLRHVVAHIALVPTDVKPTEMVTNLRPHRLTDLSNSEWWDFSISSYTGSAWIKHCHGQVKSEQTTLSDSKSMDALPRTIPETKWYKFTEALGLNYGPQFQGLTGISSSVTTKEARGQIALPENQPDAPFLSHPCSLDSSFRILLVALTNGCTESFGPCATDQLELLLQNGVLAEMYNTTGMGFGPFVCALYNKKSSLRILEIGAGTGGATGTILSDLLPAGFQGNPLYSVYIFTDISAGFFPQTTEKLGMLPT